jgi:hypothetical protein
VTDAEACAGTEKEAKAPVFLEREAFLVPSPTEEDGGHQIGRLPRDISVADFRASGSPESPLKAIRAKCIDCSGGSPSEARKCVAYKCPLWAFRMGHNPFHGKSEPEAA